MNVMILAAGEGARLRPYTVQTPKPAIPFFSVPMGYYSLALLDKIKIDRLVVNTHYLPEQIVNLYSNAHPSWDSLAFSPEPEGLLGSGGGIRKAQDLLSGRGDFFVLNGDEVILPFEMDVLAEMIKYHRWHKGIATLLTMKHPEVGKKFGGVWVRSGGNTDIRGKAVECFAKTDPGIAGLSVLHFLGVILLKESIFDYLKKPMITPASEEIQEENILYETLTTAIAAGEKVQAFETEARWFETGNPTDFIKASEWCLNEVQTGGSPYWKDYLKQAVCLYGTNSYVIEKDHPSFLSRASELQMVIKKIRNGTLSV